jgi:tRNA pseudouridine38-40 synthase
VSYAGTDRPNPRRSPLTDRYARFEPAPIDVDAMNRAAQILVGEHDFAAFGWPTAGESTVRRVELAEWVEDDYDAERGLGLYPARQVQFTITANGFLRRMVRLITGTLLDVGRGRRTVESVASALAGRDRSLASMPAPAHGLVLESVTYPVALGLW